MLNSACGASMALSMATGYGWAWASSGSTRIGVWQPRTKSRVTVKTKSGSVSNILVTNLSAVGIVISGRWAVIAGPQVFQNTSEYFVLRISGRHHNYCTMLVDTIRSRARVMIL